MNQSFTASSPSEPIEECNLRIAACTMLKCCHELKPSTLQLDATVLPVSGIHFLHYLRNVRDGRKWCICTDILTQVLLNQGCIKRSMTTRNAAASNCPEVSRTSTLLISVCCWYDVDFVISLSLVLLVVLKASLVSRSESPTQMTRPLHLW